MGANEAACVIIEGKLLKMYKRGMRGCDPELDNLRKIDFNNWKKLYGDILYIICFSVIADHSTFKSGWVQLSTKF